MSSFAPHPIQASCLMPVSPCISHPSNGYAWHTHTHSLSKLPHPRGPAFKWNTPNTLCLKSQPAFSPKDGFLPLLPSTQRPSRRSAVWCTALPYLAHGLAGTDYHSQSSHTSSDPQDQLRPSWGWIWSVLCPFPRMLRICYPTPFLHGFRETGLTDSLDVLIGSRQHLKHG